MAQESTAAEQVLSQAAQVFGGRTATRAWMSRPAMGPDQRRPIELLQTEEGTQIVRGFHIQLEYCVHC